MKPLKLISSKWKMMLLLPAATARHGSMAMVAPVRWPHNYLNERRIRNVWKNHYTGIMTYTHKDGSTTEHQILDARKAWETSNQMHGQLVPEDEILKELVDKGYIGG